MTRLKGQRLVSTPMPICSLCAAFMTSPRRLPCGGAESGLEDQVSSLGLATNPLRSLRIGLSALALHRICNLSQAKMCGRRSYPRETL